VCPIIELPENLSHRTARICAGAEAAHPFLRAFSGRWISAEIGYKRPRRSPPANVSTCHCVWLFPAYSGSVTLARTRANRCVSRSASIVNSRNCFSRSSRSHWLSPGAASSLSRKSSVVRCSMTSRPLATIRLTNSPTWNDFLEERATRIDPASGGGTRNHRRGSSKQRVNATRSSASKRRARPPTAERSDAEKFTFDQRCPRKGSSRAAA
jgi:hypothetical protein